MTPMNTPPKKRPALLSAFFAASLALLACAPSAVARTAQDDGRERLDHGIEGYAPWLLPAETSREEAAALRSRMAAINEELKAAAGARAGAYFSGGEMRQHFLRWSPGAGFVYLHVYEHFAVLDFSHGGVTVEPAEVVFNVERELRGKTAQGTRSVTPRRWVAARWKGGDYMIPAERFADFGNYVGGVGQYNDFNGPCCEFAPFLVGGRGPAGGDGSELPAVPKEYERFIKRPIEATVNFVGRKRVVRDYSSEGELYQQYYEKASLTPVRIDAGRNRGVRRGLLFRLLVADGHQGQYLKVTRVGPSSSEGVVVRRVDDDGRETYYDSGPGGGEPSEREFRPVAVGVRVTTSPPRH
jgi:hypothetical protein